MMTLKELEIGQSAIITRVGGEGALRQHFLDMGVIPGAEITLIKYAPMGDPMEFQVHGYELTLRLDDAAQIDVELIAARARSHEGTSINLFIRVLVRKASIIARAMGIHYRIAKT